MNCQSVGYELDSAGVCGEPASLGRSPDFREEKPRALRGSVGKRPWGDTGGWRQNGRKAGYMNQGDLYRDGTRQRSHSVRSSEEAP